MSVRSHETHRKELCPWTRSRSALATHLPCDSKVNFPKISPGLQLQSFRRAAAATCPGKHRLEAKASTSSIFVNNFLRSALFPAADEVATFGKQPGWKYQTAASRLRLSRKEIKHRLEICVRPCTRADFPPRRVLLLNVEPLLLGQRPLMIQLLCLAFMFRGRSGNAFSTCKKEAVEGSGLQQDLHNLTERDKDRSALSARRGFLQHGVSVDPGASSSRVCLRFIMVRALLRGVFLTCMTACWNCRCQNYKV